MDNPFLTEHLVGNNLSGKIGSTPSLKVFQSYFPNNSSIVYIDF